MDFLHGDVKPDNILIDNNNRAVIADFGLTRNCKKENLKGIYGTPTYQAPENYENKYRLDERIDIFNVGIVFYEMISGRHPFAVADSNTETVKNTMLLKYPVVQLQCPTATSFLRQTLCLASHRLNGRSALKHDFIAPLVPNALAEYSPAPAIIDPQEYPTYYNNLNVKDVTGIHLESEVIFFFVCTQ